MLRRDRGQQRTHNLLTALRAAATYHLECHGWPTDRTRLRHRVEQIGSLRSSPTEMSLLSKWYLSCRPQRALPCFDSRCFAMCRRLGPSHGALDHPRSELIDGSRQLPSAYAGCLNSGLSCEALDSLKCPTEPAQHQRGIITESIRFWATAM